MVGRAPFLFHSIVILSTNVLKTCPNLRTTTTILIFVPLFPIVPILPMMANIPNEISSENNDPQEYGSGEEDVETAIQFPDDAEQGQDLIDLYEEMYDYLTENYGDASVEAPNYDNIMDVNDEINVRVPGKREIKKTLWKVRLYMLRY